MTLRFEQDYYQVALRLLYNEKALFRARQTVVDARQTLLPQSSGTQSQQVKSPSGLFEPYSWVIRFEKALLLSWDSYTGLDAPVHLIVQRS